MTPPSDPFLISLSPPDRGPPLRRSPASRQQLVVGDVDARRAAPTRLCPRSQHGGHPLARIHLHRPLTARIHCRGNRCRGPSTSYHRTPTPTPPPPSAKQKETDESGLADCCQAAGEAASVLMQRNFFRLRRGVQTSSRAPHQGHLPYSASW